MVKKYLPMAMSKDLHSLAELWQEPVGLDPAPVEAERLFLKLKKMSLALEQIVLEAGQLDLTDIHGRQQLKSVVEMYERAQDRLADFLKFALKYELSARRLELEENQARDIGSALLGVIMDATLQLQEWQINKIRENLAEELVRLTPRLRPEWAQEFIDAEEYYE